ncbi:mucin-2 [Conger conger]|uniref:mucin-2 n=1 Tax=Conger conger TaxID=82655 RepID=UPI002A5B05FA|nr:mucin-2 [Conger conger]
MSNNDRNLDLNFLSGEEAVLIRDVLERDRLLKKREDERIRKLQEAGGVRNWLKVGSVQEARDFQSSAKHQPQQSFSTKTKGKNFSELTSRPHGLLGKQKVNQTTAALLKGASLRTRISSLFSFKSPQQKAEARLGSVGEGSSDDGRVLPVNTARPVSGAGEHTKEVPSLQREAFSPAEEHGQLKETATGEEEPRSHTRTSKSEPCQNPRHEVVKASAILTGRNPKSQGNTEAGAPQPPHSHNGVLLTSPFSHGDNDSKPPSSVSQLPPSTMLSSALATVLAQPWSSRFRRQRAESGSGKEEEELRQEAGDWARFLKPCRPFTEEVPGCPGNKNITPKSHPFPGSQEQHFQDEDVFPGPDCRDGAHTESGMALLPTPPETPCITATRSLDYQCYRRESQAGFLSPRFRERSSLLSSKPTTSSFLLSLRRLSSARGSPCTSSAFTNTPPASPGSCTLPGARSITQERPRPSGELSRGVSIKEGQLPPYTGRTGHRELTDWLNSLNAQSLKHRNTLSSSECRKGSQQDDDYITPSNFMTSAGNTTTGTNLNLLDFSNTATDTNHNLLSPNKNVTGPGNTTTSTSHNILSLESATSSINTTTFGQNHNLNSHSTYNHTHGLLNTYNARKTTPKSPSTLNSNTNLNSSETISSPKTPKLNTLKSTKTPYTPFGSNSSKRTYPPLSPNTPITPGTIKSPNTLFSPRIPISTNAPLSPNTPTTHSTLRSPNTPFTRKTPVRTNTPLSPNTPITPDSLRSPNTPSTLFSPNTCTYTPLSPNAPITPDTLKSPNTLFSPRTPKSTTSPLSPNTPTAYNTLRSPNSPFSPKSPVSTNTPLSPNKSITRDHLERPNTSTQFSPNTCTYTPVSLNTPSSFKAHRSPTTPFSPKTHVSTNTLLSPNIPITPDSLRRPNTASTVFSPNTCTYTPVSPNTPIPPEAPTSQNTSFSPKTPVSTNTPLSPNKSITRDNLERPNTASTQFSPNTCTYTPVSPNTPITPETPKSQNSPFSSRSHIGTTTHLSPNTPISFNTHRSPTTPFSPKAPVSAKTAVSPNSLITPETPKSQNTPFSSRSHIGTTTHLSPNTPISFKAHRSPTTPFSPKTHVSTNTLLSPNIPITPDSLRRPNTTSTVFSPNTCTYTPVSPNIPIPPETPTSQNTSFSPKTPVSTNTPLSLNKSITRDNLERPKTASTQFIPNTCTYTPVSPNTPTTPETPKSQNTPFSSRSHIGTTTHLSPNTPISFNAHRSLTTPFSPKTHVSTNTLLSTNAPITPDSLRRPNTASTVFSPNTCTYTPVSPNTPITPEAPTSQSTSFGPKRPVSTNTPLSPNTPGTAVSSNKPISTNISTSPNTFNRLNRQNILNSSKSLSNGNVGTVDSVDISAINSPNSPISHKHLSSSPCSGSTLNSTKVPRLFLSRTQPVEDQAKANHTIIPSNAELEGVASCSTGKGKGGPEALKRPISPSHYPLLRRTSHTMEEPPFFSSLRTAGSSPCLLSPDPDQTVTPWRCHLSQGHNPSSMFTFDSGRDFLLVKSEKQAPLQNTSAPSLSSSQPLYSRDAELPPSTLAPHHVSWSSDRSWAVPMDSTGNITSPHSYEPGGETSLPVQFSVSAHLRTQPQSNAPAGCKTSQDMFSFVPETNPQYSATGIGSIKGMRTDSTLQLSALQHPECKPQMSPNQSPASTDHFNQSFTSIIDSPTNQGSKRIGESLNKYSHSLPPPKTCIPPTKSKGIVGNKECDSLVEEHDPAVSMKHSSINRSPLMFSSKNNNFSPPVPGIATQPVAPMCDGSGKSVTEGNKGNPKVYQVPSSIEMTKHFHDESLTTRKKSISMINMSSLVSEGSWAGDPGRWQDAGVLRPLNHENKTGSRKPRNQREAAGMHLPKESTQPGPVQNGNRRGLKNDNKNHSYQRYATVPGRPSCFDINSENVEYENAFYSTSTDATYPRSQRRKSTSFCEPEDVRQANINSLSPSTSLSPTRVFGLYHGRSFSVSSVHSSRPSGCGRISTGRKLGSSLDLCSADVDVTSWGLIDLGADVQQRATQSFSLNLDQDTTLERNLPPYHSEMSLSPLPSPPESPRPSRRISSSSTTSRSTLDTASPRSRLPSRGYRSSLSAFEESDSDTTTDDEYYLSPDRGERETEL